MTIFYYIQNRKNNITQLLHKYYNNIKLILHLLETIDFLLKM